MGDYFTLYKTGGTGKYMDREEVQTFGPYAEDLEMWTSEVVMIDPDECYIFLATDGHDGAPFGYPPSDVTYDGSRFFCTGECDGCGGDVDSCTFGNACPPV